MTYVQLFHKLDTPQKDAFCDNLLNLGLVSELNPTAWNKTIKAAIKGSKGGGHCSRQCRGTSSWTSWTWFTMSL